MNGEQSPKDRYLVLVAFFLPHGGSFTSFEAVALGYSVVIPIAMQVHQALASQVGNFRQLPACVQRQGHLRTQICY